MMLDSYDFIGWILDETATLLNSALCKDSLLKTFSHIHYIC